MRWAFALFLLSPSAWACSPSEYTPCKADESHFTIVVDSVSTMLSRENVTLNVKQLDNHQSASIRNLSDKPLYLITDAPDEALPFFMKDKKKWFIQARYTKDSPVACFPKAPSKTSVDINKLEWNCEEERDGCGVITNTNELILPPARYPLGWAATGLVKDKIVLPETKEQKFLQYFLHDGKIEKVSLVSTVIPNDDYLKVTCDNNAKIESCGTNCIAYINTATALTSVVSASFKLKIDEHDFSDRFEIEFFVDKDFRSEVPDSGATLVRAAVDALLEIQQYGKLDELPLPYLAHAIGDRVFPELIKKIGPAWKFQLNKISRSPASKRTKPKKKR